MNTRRGLFGWLSAVCIAPMAFVAKAAPAPLVAYDLLSGAKPLTMAVFEQMRRDAHGAPR